MIPEEFESLIKAIKDGDLGLVQKMLNDEPIGRLDNDDKVNNYKKKRLLNEAVIIASTTGKTDILETLLSNGLDINQAGNGVNPLDAAVQLQSIEVVKFLVEKGVKLGNRNGDGYRCSYYLKGIIDEDTLIEMSSYLYEEARKQGDEQVCEEIRKALSNEVLKKMSATQSGEEKLQDPRAITFLNRLFNKGLLSDGDFKAVLRKMNEEPLTKSLCDAIKDGAFPKVESLIERGANIMLGTGGEYRVCVALSGIKDDNKFIEALDFLSKKAEALGQDGENLKKKMIQVAADRAKDKVKENHMSSAVKLMERLEAKGLFSEKDKEYALGINMPDAQPKTPTRKTSFFSRAKAVFSKGNKIQKPRNL